VIDQINVTVTQAPPINVTVAPPAPINVEFSQTQGLGGPPGAGGAQGAQGEQGAQGIPGGTTYTFTQSMPAALWTITHNLNRFPSVEVTDSTGRIVEGDEQYVDANTLTVAFSAPFSGEAYLN
jgi:hypothetical protein